MHEKISVMTDFFHLKLLRKDKSLPTYPSPNKKNCVWSRLEPEKKIG